MTTNYNSSNIAGFSELIGEASGGSKLDLIKSALAADVAKVSAAAVSGGTVQVTLNSGAHLVARDGSSGIGADIVDALFFDSSSVSGSPLSLNLTAAQAAELNFVLFDQAGTDNVTLAVSSADFRGSVILGGGNDTVALNSTRGVLVDGGDGNDSIVTGTGRDTVVVGAGSDSVFTSAGNDTIIFPSSWGQPQEHATVDGGLGTDTLNLSGLTGQNGNIVSVTQSAGVVTVTFADGSIIDASNIEAVIYADDAGDVKLVGVSTFILTHEQPPSV